MVYSTEIMKKAIAEGRYDELVYFSEQKHLLQFENMYYEIKHSDSYKADDNVTDAIFITGPSASGKTTFTNVLKSRLQEYGYTCHVISLDNYYLPVKQIGMKQFGNIDDRDFEWLLSHCDFETPDALDHEFFTKQMRDLCEGKEIQVSEFDFNDGTRKNNGTKVQPGKKEMVLIEGINALNPRFYQNIPFRRIFRVYIAPFDRYDVTDNGGNIFGRIEPKAIRFMRRSYRDSIHRNAPLAVNLGMLPNVRAGEDKYIKPQKQYADFFFNTSITYELPFLVQKFKKLTEPLKKEEWQDLVKYMPMDLIDAVPEFTDFYVPDNSIFREFST